MNRSKVTLRKRPIEKGKRKSFYLDFYPPLIHPNTKKETRRLALGIYVYTKPEGTLQKDANEAARQSARDKTAEIEILLSKGDLSFLRGVSEDAGFIAYCRSKLKEVSVDRNLKWRSIRSTNTSINWLEKYMGEIPLENVDHNMVLGFRRYLREEGKAQSTIKTYDMRIIYFIDWAYNENKIPPLKKKLIEWPRGGGKKRSTPTLTPDEINLLVDTPSKNPVVKRLGLFCLSTALRIGDALKLTFDDLIYDKSVDRHYLKITLEKTGARVKIELNDEALYLIGNAGQKKVFPIGYKVFLRGLKSWAEDAGIAWSNSLGSHSFRATALDAHANREGVGLDVAQRVAAHSTIATTQIYAGTDQSRIRDAVDKHTFGIIEKMKGV